jgi:HEAT repeat protein
MYATDPANTVRETALATLARARAPDALPLLVAATAPDQARALRTTAAQLLGHYREPRGEDALERLTANVEDRDLRAGALESLATTGDSARATAVALRYLGDYDPLFAVAAVQVVGRVGGADGKARLTAALAAEKRVTVRQAIQRVLNGH